MILLDTSAVAEAMKPEPDTAFVSWLDDQKAESLFITSISVAELLAGIGLIDDSSRKDGLASALDRTLQLFSGRVLVFEQLAAWSFADISVKAIRRGKAYSSADMYIAAIAAAHGIPIAARNPAIFTSLEVPAFSPWVGTD